MRFPVDDAGCAAADETALCFVVVPRGGASRRLAVAGRVVSDAASLNGGRIALSDRRQRDKHIRPAHAHRRHLICTRRLIPYQCIISIIVQSSPTNHQLTINHPQTWSSPISSLPISPHFPQNPTRDLKKRCNVNALVRIEGLKWRSIVTLATRFFVIVNCGKCLNWSRTSINCYTELNALDHSGLTCI